MKKQVGSPEILKKSHKHKSKKDYSRKNEAKVLKEIKNGSRLDKYFSDSFKEFEDEYRKFINYFEIKQLHTNKIRAFILRYLEKGNQYIDIDRINSAKVKHWSQRNA